VDVRDVTGQRSWILVDPAPRRIKRLRVRFRGAGNYRPSYMHVSPHTSALALPSKVPHPTRGGQEMADDGIASMPGHMRHIELTRPCPRPPRAAGTR
jgi:hypothetical protein